VLFADYLFGSQLLYGSDSIPAGMFHRSLVVEFLKDFGELPRWNPFVLGGLPFLDAQHGDTFYPLSLLHFTMPVHRAMGHKLLINIVLAGAFMAFYLRTLRLSPAATLFGAIAYALCPLFVSHLYTGQDGRSYVIALTPLVLGTLERALRAGTVGMWIATGVTISSGTWRRCSERDSCFRWNRGRRFAGLAGSRASYRRSGWRFCSARFSSFPRSRT
jgi:hypothetical protein